jgi:hypothetical protein
MPVQLCFEKHVRASQVKLTYLTLASKLAFYTTCVPANMISQAKYGFHPHFAVVPSHVVWKNHQEFMCFFRLGGHVGVFA